MNFNNNLPNFSNFPQQAQLQDSQLESLMKLFSSTPQTTPPLDLSSEDRQKNPSNIKALMTQMLLNNYRNCMMLGPQMNPLMMTPPSANLLSMLSGSMQPPNDPMGLRRNNVMNDVMFQAFLSKFNMLNMFNPYQMYPPGMNNPLLNSMMMDTLFRNYLKESTIQPTDPSVNASNYTVINLDTIQLHNEVCICTNKKNTELDSNSNAFMTCSNDGCKKKYHLSCLKYKQPELECPICFLKKMDPLHQVCKVLMMPFLITSTPNVIYKKRFQLDMDTSKQVMENEDVFVELRSLRLDENYKYENSWFDYGTVSMNEMIVSELNPLLLNSCLKKRKDEKITIKQYMKSDVNEIKITIKDYPNEEEAKTYRIDKKAEFLIGVYLIKKISPNELMKSLIEKNKKSEEECKSFLQSYFSQDLCNHEDDIYLDQMKINLLDPIDFQVIKTPCRGRFCKHYNCFSLETFLTITKDSNPRKWRCPICKKPCYEFQIDEYLLRILNEAKNESKKIKEMILFDDGRYNMIEEVLKLKDNDEQSDKEEESKEENKLNTSLKDTKDNKESNKISLMIDEKNECFIKDKDHGSGAGVINDNISEHTKSTLNESNKNIKIEKNTEDIENFNGINKKRKFKEIAQTTAKEEAVVEDTNKKGGYHLRSKKVCKHK